ncbi:T9SS type A sorting domain-containing protein [Marinilongibacter aquaticus]|uniref:T9SS type A sorting domain-containing protein n=1 Tax=Marinilongibacter aquaticus TaxID=2975157 RepID=UPI0021BD2C42|nr:T9SS type A sorting domain-containing protein [Marinilongibacter aquaticus]UBM60933.1 T9SS type A sorting domain-containing protein [Marinilongibacter aquaticus]
MIKKRKKRIVGLSLLLGVVALGNAFAIDGVVYYAAFTGAAPGEPVIIGKPGSIMTVGLDFAGAGSFAVGDLVVQIDFPQGSYSPTAASDVVSGAVSDQFTWTWDGSVLQGINNVAIDNSVTGMIVVNIFGNATTWSGSGSPTNVSTTVNLNDLSGTTDSDGTNNNLIAGIGVVDGPNPVKLLSFTASKEGSIALLRWGTAEEVNVDRFEILQSLDAKNWRSVGAVAALGESTTDHWYSFNDANPANGTNYYRIKSVDRDGATDFSNIQSLEFEVRNTAVFYPNPVAETLKLKGENLANVSKVTVLNMMGSPLVETNTLSEEGINVRQLPAGAYIVRLERKNGSVNAFKVIKQ